MTRAKNHGEPRKRSAVVRLDAYREATRTARWLSGVLERARWVLGVRAEATADGRVIIAIIVEPPLSVMRRRCLPTACNHIPTEVREETVR